MQTLDSDYINSLPDHESLSQYLKSLPCQTLHLFSSNQDDLLVESRIIEENYQKIINFLILFIEKTDRNLNEKTQEIDKISRELDNTRYYLEHNQSIARDVSDHNKTLIERTQLLISKNQELEQFNAELANSTRTIELPQSQPHYLACLEEDEDFLRDFFQREDNKSFLKNLRLPCECKGRLQSQERELEKKMKETEDLLEENECLRSRNQQLEKKIVGFGKDLRKGQVELAKMREKNKLYETVKYEFLLSSKKPLIELEVQSASKVKQERKVRRTRFRRRNTLKTNQEILSAASQQDSLTLLSDIEKTLGNEEDDSHEELIELREGIRFRYKQKSPLFSSTQPVKMPKKYHLKANLMDFWLFLVVTLVNLLIRLKDIGLKGGVSKILMSWPKILIILIALYWMNVGKLMIFVFEGAQEVWGKILRLPFMIVRKMLGY